jgi:hypothetical protein
MSAQRLGTSASSSATLALSSLPLQSAAAAVGDLSCIERGLVRVFPSAKSSESRFLSQTELSSNEKAVAGQK